MDIAICTSAAAAGASTHVLFFKTHEHHQRPQRYIQYFALGLVVVVHTTIFFTGYHWSIALIKALPYIAAYLLGLLGALLVFRLYQNPLNSIPGPSYAKISRFGLSLQIKDNDAHRQLLKLHQQYGQYVRVGPNDVSVTDPKAIQVILGPGSKCTKGAWYDQDSPFFSVLTSRSDVLHDQRRPLWEAAFSEKMLQGYEHRIEQLNVDLIQQIIDSESEPMNMALWITMYSYDVMGDLTFGKSYGMLESGEVNEVVSCLTDGKRPLTRQFPPWFHRLLASIPRMWPGYVNYLGDCTTRMDERLGMKHLDYPDISAPFIQSYRRSEDPNTELQVLLSDSRLIPAAGGDTVASVLTHLLYHLARDEKLLSKLRKEVEPLMGKAVAVIHDRIKDAPLLNAVINETLRLYPPVPCGVYRKVPSEGIRIGDHFVPGNTTVQIPGYAMARDESVYADCESFVPERWMSKSDMVKDKDAFIPFSIGPNACVGKDLALMEIRVLITRLVRLFDIALAPGEDGTRLLNKSMDHFTLSVTDLDLVFTPRKRR